MKRCIITYAEGAHEELLEVALPTYKKFAHSHSYELVFGEKKCNLPSAWNKIPLLIDALKYYEEVVWFDCDLIIVNPTDDFDPITSDVTKGIFTQNKLHSMVRHFEDNSEVPNSGVWRLRRSCDDLSSGELLHHISLLEVFTNHGWWEQAALMTLMGYTVPSEGSEFSRTKCKNVNRTKWYNSCQFMRLCWNSHPNYRAENPRIVHCSYPNMVQRIEVMRELVKDPTYNYPRYDEQCKYCKKTKLTEKTEEV